MINKLTRELIKPFLFEIERKDMPQVAEKDIEEMIAIFEDNGIGYKAGPVTISRLHPTQEDFKPDKVKEMVDNLKSNKMVLFPIVVSEDGYILDGHHRWLAAKELYGENSQIPAIIVDLPKDEALLMFTKTSDKIDETITENPDTIYDRGGSELAAHAHGTAIAFGYNYDGEMFVGGPNVWHMAIADWYDEFDHDTARNAPEDRGEMEYSGRFWVEDKLISFWEYPSKEALSGVLKDIQDELHRIHDEFPDFAVESGLPLVDFDEDGWKIDLYTSEDREYAGVGTDKTFTADEKPSDEKPKTDADKNAEFVAKYKKQPKQGSLDLAPYDPDSDPYDPDSDVTRGDYSDEDPDYSDDYGNDPEDITTGTQIPIKNYTGQTDKEKKATAAAAQSIQHVLSPLDKDKKDVPTGLGSRKQKHSKMSNAEYKDFICREEKTLANFLVDSLLTETPDTVYDKDGVVIADHATDGVPFGYFEGKMYIGAINDHHPEIAGVYKKIDDKRKWDLQKEWPTSRRHYKFSGRFWAKEKLISFWDYPEASEIDKVFRDIEEEIPRFKNLFEKYIETSDEGETRLFLKWHDVPAEAVKFDNDWKIDTAEGVTDLESDLESLDAYGHQISVGEYKKDYEDSETPAQWSPEKMAQQHVLPPGHPDKEKKEVPPGFGSRKKKGGMSATQYQQYVCTSEGKTLAKFLVNKIITENPDRVYDKQGEKLAHYSEGGQAFGYYKGKMYLSMPNETHPTITGIYHRLERNEERKKDLVGGPEDKSDFEYAGRFWEEQKMVSFWKYPDGSELDKIFRDIKAESIRLQDMVNFYIDTADEDEVEEFKDGYGNIEFEPPKFDDTWTMDTAVDGDSILGRQISVDAYKNNSKKKAQWSPETMALQHTMSPTDPEKMKKDVSPGLGSRKRKAGMTSNQYQQYVCTSEGKTLSDFLVKNILTEDPDTVYDEKGKKKAKFDAENEFPFGYNRDEHWIRDHYGYSYKQMNKRIKDADKIRVGELGKTHDDMSIMYDFDHNEYSADDRDDFKISGRVFMDEKIISFWEFPKPEQLQQVLRDIEKEAERIKSSRLTPSKYPTEKSRKIADIKFDDSWKIDIPADDDAYFGIQIPIKDFTTGLTKRQKASSAERAKEIQHVVSPVDKEKKEVPPGLGSRKLKHSKMSNAEYRQFTCREGISEDTDTSVIKKKINNVEFEFKYNEHVIEPYFTVSRDGVIVDRMPATLSSAEMKAFFQQNYSRWQADYVKSFGATFTQLPQQGVATQENKENLLDISVFLE